MSTPRSSVRFLGTNSSGLAPVKKEYFGRVATPSTATTTATAAAAPPPAPSSTTAGKSDAASAPPPPVDSYHPKDRAKRKGGQNKKRRRNDKRNNNGGGGIDRRASQMCKALAVNLPCGHGPTCPYSHDSMKFWKAKMVDIGPSCPLYATHGHCPFGLTCRFGNHHTTLLVAEDGTESLQFAPSAAITERCHGELNKLPHTVQHLLRKHKYPFATSSSRFAQKGKKQGKKNKGKKHAARELLLQQQREQQQREEAARDVATVAAIEGAAAPPLSASVATALAGSTVGIGPDACVQLTLRAAGTAAGTTEAGGAASAAPAAAAPTTLAAIGAVVVREKRPLDLAGKIYIAPLTTVGNLPYRCVMKSFGADITCSEMAVATNLLKGQSSEWSLLRRHPCEDVFGIQVAGSRADIMTRCAELLEKEDFSFDFVDINSGCPIDCITGRGAGSALMTRPSRLEKIVRGMSSQLTCPVTVKIRAGWNEKKLNAPSLVATMQKWGGRDVVGAVSVHGRTRAARYTRAANWDLIRRCATEQSAELAHLPVVGNGDIFSWEHWAEAMELSGGLSTGMLARGALIKPWLPTEIKERRHWDISAGERFEMLKKYCDFGLMHWGSDAQGVANTRRFLLEWLSFLCRYIPVGLLERLPARLNDRPPIYHGRSDLETLMASRYVGDWLKIAEMLLGPCKKGFTFEPKHRANAYPDVSRDDRPGGAERAAAAAPKKTTVTDY